MNYRSILVQVDSTRGAKARIAAAISIAASQHASVTGVFLKSELAPAYMMGEGVAIPVLAADAFLAGRRDRTADASRDARVPFNTMAGNADVAVRWVEIDGDSDDALVAHARRHDLVILPRHMSPAFGDTSLSAERIAMACGGPVLIMPEAGYPATFGKRILVAWKDSRESARVLRDAWPFLAAAEEVVFVTATAEGRRRLDDVLQRHLAEHGCKKTRLVVDDDDVVPAGEVIRRHIDMIGADMVVLGLYGHSRLRELVLGGVSRNMLDHLTMPTLVSH